MVTQLCRQCGVNKGKRGIATGIATVSKLINSLVIGNCCFCVCACVYMCARARVCVRARSCMRACVRACVCACVWAHLRVRGSRASRAFDGRERAYECIWDGTIYFVYGDYGNTYASTFIICLCN